MNARAQKEVSPRDLYHDLKSAHLTVHQGILDAILHARLEHELEAKSRRTITVFAASLCTEWVRTIVTRADTCVALNLVLHDAAFVFAGITAGPDSKVWGRRIQIARRVQIVRAPHQKSKRTQGHES